MCPFELVATATDSPRYSPGGSFRKFGTDVKGISGTFCALAFCCASAGAAHRTRARAEHDASQGFIETSRIRAVVATMGLSGGTLPHSFGWLNASRTRVGL